MYFLVNIISNLTANVQRKLGLPGGYNFKEEKEMEQNVKGTLISKNDVADVVLVVHEFVNKLGPDIVKEVMEEVNEEVWNLPHRKGKWKIVRLDEKYTHGRAWDKLLCGI